MSTTQRAELASEIITSLWNLRKEFREMALANVQWTTSAPVVNFRMQGLKPYSDADVAAAREMIADAEIELMKLTCPSAFN
jgi:hypothetical protein